MGRLDWFVAVLAMCAIQISTGKAAWLSIVCFLASLYSLARLLNRRKRLLGWTWGSGSLTNSLQSSGPSGTVELNESLHQLYKPTGKPRMQVLFFHGFQFGDSTDAHLATWKSGDGSCIWPQTWLVDEFPGAHIFSVSYNACVMQSFRHGEIDMYIVGENLTSDLLEANVGQEPSCPVILVGHCIGGMVIKELCLHAHGRFHLTEKPKLKTFLESIKGIFYYGTPHHGIPFMDRQAHSMDGPLVDYVKLLSKEAERLNSRFTQLCTLYQWRISALGESRRTELSPGKFEMVSPESSARIGECFNVVDADHMSICRPMKKTSKSYYALTGLLHKIDDDVKEDDLAREEARAQKAGCPDNFQHLPQQIVGLALAVEKVKAKLDRTSSLGLFGMGGIGKTTLAQAVFNILGPQYEYTCFVPDVKHIQGGVELAKQAVFDHVCKQGKKINAAEKERGLNFLIGKRLLLVLDDVASEKPGLDIVSILQNDVKVHGESRFVVTSRDAKLLKPLKADYQVPFLDGDSSTRLFVTHAFHNLPDSAPPSYLREHVASVVTKCGGLPLTLEVLGKLLCGEKDKAIWKQVVKALEKANDVNDLDEQVWAKLRLSYDRLDKVDQEMFLDAATVFYNSWLHEAKEAWSFTTTMKDTEHVRWQRLVQRSLVFEVKAWRFDRSIYVGMHEQLRSLGRKIALTSGENGKCSRIWDSKTAWELLSGGNSSSESDDIKDIVALRLDGDEVLKGQDWLGSFFKADHSPISEDGLLESAEKWKTGLKEQLRLIKNGQFEAKEGWNIDAQAAQRLLGSTKALKKLVYKDTRPDLRFIDHMERISHRVEMIASRSSTSQPTSNMQTVCIARNTLCRMKKLQYLCLDQVDIDWLEGEQFPSSLVFLHWNSASFTQLPFDTLNLKSLAVLALHSCHLLQTLPSKFAQLSALRILRIVYARSLVSLPDSFGYLSSLKWLEIKGADSLMSLPESFGHLLCLKRLKLDICANLKELPESFGRLQNLKRLEITDCGFCTLPPIFGELSQLHLLVISACHDLEALPQSFGHLLKLQELTIEGCPKLQSLPETFGELAALEIMQLQDCDALSTLPESFGRLSGLRKLIIEQCPKLQWLPKTFGELAALKTLRLEDCDNLQNLPDSFGHLTMLENLTIRDCHATPMFQSLGSIESLQSLQTLHLRWSRTVPKFPSLPRCLGNVITERNMHRTVGWTFKVVDGQFRLKERQKDKKERLSLERVDEPESSLRISKDGSVELNSLGLGVVDLLGFQIGAGMEDNRHPLVENHERRGG